MKKMKGMFNKEKRYSLANQLVASFLIIFLLIFTLSSLVAYFGVLNVLKNNAKDTNEQQFKQYDYNLSTFANEVDQISRQLLLDSELQNMINFKSMKETDSVVQISKTFKNFSQILTDYKYIDAISFFGDKGVALRTTLHSNEILVDPANKVNQFYQSEIYDQVKFNAQKLIWFGGFTDKDFVVSADASLYGAAAQPTSYISAVRSFFSVNQLGTLIIHVDLKYFTDIYNRSNDNRNELYLIDKTGKVVSHSNEARIGEYKTYLLNYLPSGDDKFSSEERDGKQIMSYQISSLDWVLINEIPVSVFIKDIQTLRLIVITMFISSLTVAAILSRYWIRKVTHPLLSLTTVIKKMGQGNLGLTLDLDIRNELGILIAQFNRMSKNILDLMEQKETIEEKKRMIEIGALQSQINPHFFYNSLNTIKWMAIMAKADNIVESITTLGDYLQPMFKKGMLCTIQEEIDYIENYIKIMNYRMAGGIKIHNHIAVEVRECQILRFLLQPLVENAISHGLKDQNGGVIDITAVEQKNEIVWSIRDNGEGMSEQRLQEVRESLVYWDGEDMHEMKGIGLYNTNRRIQLHFGDHYSIQIDSKLDVGTELKFTIPKVQ